MATFCQVRDMMDRQMKHMVRLVDDLLDVSRISRGKIELQKERLDLATVVHGAWRPAGFVLRRGTMNWPWFCRRSRLWLRAT